MKIIITYASAGAGHFKAAEAVYNYFKQDCLNKDLDVQLVDVLEKSTSFFKRCYLAGYAVLIRHITFIWAIAFWFTSFKLLRPLTRPISSLINYLNTQKFAKFLIQENPDYVISAHFLPSEIAAHLKQAKKIKSKIITVVTDFGVHPYWLSKGTDTYVVASSFTREILIKEGVDSSIVKEFGIPIDEKFTKTYNKEELCRKLEIDSSKFTLLIMTGSFGIGPIEETVELLRDQMQILVVCANNKKLFEQLKNKNYPTVRTFAFVNNVQELMAVSDCIVTKPGGLSSSELLSMALAPIFIAAIPGQETINMHALESLGVGISATNAEDIKNKVLDYKEYPEKLKTTKDRIQQIRKPHAAGELCNAVCQGRI